MARLAPVAEKWAWRGTIHINYGNVIATMFNEDVMSNHMTLEALCDQVRAWEDELAAKGINVEQVAMIATPEATHEPAAEHTEKVSV